MMSCPARPGGNQDCGRFEVERLRRDFPALHQKVNGKSLVYLDNAATTQKPRAVLDALEQYYTQDNANVHRGVHTLSVRATEAYESARRTVQQFLGAASTQEVVFVRGATEAINLVAGGLTQNLRPDDEVLISAMEHHSNIVPWQVACQRSGAKLRVAPMDGTGELLLEEYEKLLGPRTRIVAITHLSNALGTVNPIRQIIELAHARDIPVLVDAAQSAAHLGVNVRELDCDFLVFSGHKIYGPTGIGVLYGRSAQLDKLPIYQSGGDMIKSVSFERTTYNDLPYRFEAGTPNIAGAIGLAAALDYLHAVGMDSIAAYESELLDYAAMLMEELPGVKLIGTAPQRASVLSFVIEGVHPHDVGTILDTDGIAIRAGHHCAQPVMEQFGIPATVRASFAFYNTRAEIEALAAGVRKVAEVFQ